MKKILVITSVIPNDLAGGDRLYTYHLYKALAQYASVTVIGYKDLHDRVIEHENWVQEIITVPYIYWPQYLSVLSIYSNQVFENRTTVFKKTLKQLVQNKDYDVIICDHYRTFWAADIVNRERKWLGKVRIPTILVTHNHEALVRDKLAKNETNLIKSLVFWLDAKKTRWHENKALLGFDKVTAISTTDAKSISAVSGQKTDVLTPGYSERIKNEHQITQETSKQVVVLGNYYWVAKQLNRRLLVKAAASIFPKAGIKMILVGPGPASLIHELSQYPFVKVAGYVESFDKYLEESRIAIIAETTGGGFKLRALDYVFGKVPMAVIKGTMEGMPLQAGVDYLEYSTMNELIEGVVREIDNIEKLNMLASNTLAACQNKFKWKDRGCALYKIVCDITGKKE